MIEYLKGPICDAGESSLVVEVGGLALRALCSLTTISELSDETGTIVLYTRLLLRENNPPELFGFHSEDERAVFDQLCDVKGVSGRIALSLLSKLSPAGIAVAIGEQDEARLQLANGVGRRLAERIVVELREKITRLSLSESSAEEPVAVSSVAGDAIAGLVALGYKSAQARAAVIDYMRKEPGSAKAADIIQGVLKQR